MRTLFFSAALLVGAATAMADAPKDPPKTADATKMATDDCARARKQGKTCVLDMGKGDEIEVGKTVPGGIGVSTLKFGRHESLIRVRKDFIVEILKSAEDID
jgi:hypothetical protein